MADTDRTAILPAHIEGTVEAIARLHADHRDRATPFQAFIANLTSRAGRPSFIAWLTALMAGWVAFNLVLIGAGRQPLDEPPFAWLELFASLLALVMTVMILTTQRRDELAGHRDQLTLELAIMSFRSASETHITGGAKRTKNRVIAQWQVVTAPMVGTGKLLRRTIA